MKKATFFFETVKTNRLPVSYFHHLIGSSSTSAPRVPVNGNIVCEQNLGHEYFLVLCRPMFSGSVPPLLCWTPCSCLLHPQSLILHITRPSHGLKLILQGDHSIFSYAKGHFQLGIPKSAHYMCEIRTSTTKVSALQRYLRKSHS